MTVKAAVCLVERIWIGKTTFSGDLHHGVLPLGKQLVCKIHTLLLHILGHCHVLGLFEDLVDGGRRTFEMCFQSGKGEIVTFFDYNIYKNRCQHAVCPGRFRIEIVICTTQKHAWRLHSPLSYLAFIDKL